MTTAVIDASTLVDALLPGSNNDIVRHELNGISEFAGPEHLGIEVLSVLRRLHQATQQAAPSLVTARHTLAQLNIRRVALDQIHERVWELRESLTAYDAAYAAAAEHLHVPLMTSDHALIRHPGVRCTIINPRSR